MYFFHFISGWHCLFSLNIGAYKAKRHWKVWSQGFPQLLDIDHSLSSSDGEFCRVPLLRGPAAQHAVYVMGSGVMWSMWWAQVWCDLCDGLRCDVICVMGSGVMWSMWWAQVWCGLCDGLRWALWWSGLLCSQELPLEKLPFPKECSSCYNDPLLGEWVTPSIQPPNAFS